MEESSVSEAPDPAIPLYDETGRPRFYADAGTDRFAAIVLRLASELWVARERIDTLERLLVQVGVLQPGSIDGFRPDNAVSGERQVARQAFIGTVLAPLRESSQAGINPVP